MFSATLTDNGWIVLYKSDAGQTTMAGPFKGDAGHARAKVVAKYCNENK